MKNLSKKLTREEMKAITGSGPTGNWWTCNTSGPFCHVGNPADHTDPSCSDFTSCVMGATCPNPFLCP
ncbi:MAG TPA: hypothetical protein VJ844_03710 [Mucilaginibacter sp.]|nr:hypothetical protein [Mucilaginibacter sp.]